MLQPSCFAAGVWAAHPVAPADGSWCSALLAEGANWRRMGDRFGADASINTRDLWVVVAVCVAAGVAIWGSQALVRRWESSKAAPNPARLLRALCRAHGLSGRQSALVRAIADAANLDQPADAFWRPDLFAVRALPETLVDRSAEVQQLANRLFADLRQKRTPRG